MNAKQIIILCTSALLGGCLFTNPAPVDNTTSPDADMTRVDMGGGVDMEADMSCVVDVPSEQDACASAQATCGTAIVMDGCGASVEISCGVCGERERCEQNQCVCDAPAPQQATQCGQREGEFCGAYDILDGCGGVVGMGRCDECDEGLVCDEMASQCAVVVGPCECDPNQTCNEQGECVDRCDGPSIEQVCGENAGDHNLRCRTSYTTTCEGNLGVVTCPEAMMNMQDPLFCSEVAIFNPIDASNDFSTTLLFHNTPAIEGELLFVGAPALSGGFVHMYLLSSSGEVLHHDQLASTEISSAVTSLGSSLQAVGDTLFIGAPGSRNGGTDHVIALSIDTSDRRAPKFERSALHHRLLDIPNTLGERPEVGSALLLDEKRGVLLVGAPGANDAPLTSHDGRVLAYQIKNMSKPSDWIHTTIAPPESGGNMRQAAAFGASLALIPTAGGDTDMLAIGAPRLSPSNEDGQGTVYLLSDRADKWSIIESVRAPVNTSNFGSSLYGGSAVLFVGAPTFTGMSPTPSKVYQVRSTLDAGLIKWTLDTTPIHTDLDTKVGIALAGRGDDLVITASKHLKSPDDSYALRLNTQGLAPPIKYAPSRANGDLRVSYNFGGAASFGERLIAIGDSTGYNENGMGFGAVHLFPID